MKKKLIIVGTGLFAEVARDYFQEFTDYLVVAFSCHAKYAESDTKNDLPLVAIEELNARFPPDSCELFVAIGYGKMNRMRQSTYEELKQKGYQFATFVHPDVKIWKTSSLGENVFIFEDNTIQPYTQIGDNTILWSGNHIGHHSIIGAHCFISSHVVISGSCKIGNNVFMGVNCTLHDSIEIAQDCLIGAGAIVTKSTQVAQVLLSPPASVYKKNSFEIGF